MNRVIALGAVLIIAAIGTFSHVDKAFACTKTNGCVMDIFRDDYDMKRDGRMDKAMQAGQDNMEAFRKLCDAEAKAGKR